jgi:hypothetical protein
MAQDWLKSQIIQFQSISNSFPFLDFGKLIPAIVFRPVTRNTVTFEFKTSQLVCSFVFYIYYVKEEMMSAAIYALRKSTSKSPAKFLRRQ